MKNSRNIQDDDTEESSEKRAVSRLHKLEDVGPAFDFNAMPVKD